MTTATQRTIVERVYDNWAKEYDEACNPITMLEGRALAALLPPIENADVVDLGCGTGRNFQLFSERGARSIAGVDVSLGMLDLAARRDFRNVQLCHADASAVPVENGGADLIVGSLLGSYVLDLSALASEIRRISRTDAKVILTDLHPETVRTFEWKRVASSRSGSRNLPAVNRDVEEIIDAFKSVGFNCEISLNIKFGAPEREVFARAGRLEDFERFAKSPAIYVLQFGLGPAAHVSTSISNADIVLGAELVASGSMQFCGGIVSSFGQAATCAVDIGGMTVYPGLVNAHDHLEFGSFPRLGNRLYRSAKEWAHSIHETYSSTIAASRRLDRKHRCAWGALRNALAGVATVSHHNELHSELQSADFPVRVHTNFSWAHSLDFDHEVREVHEGCGPDTPFIIHAGEAALGDASSEMRQLKDLGILDSRTVIVHGNGFSHDNLYEIEQRGCSIVWCPSSNYFLFGTTHDGEFIEQFPRVALGSDSPITAAGDLLDEIRFAHSVIGVSPESLFEQVTSASSEVLRLRRGEGTLRLGGVADFFAIRGLFLSPAERLVELTFRDVELVVNGGKVTVASNTVFESLTDEMREHLVPIEIDGALRWVRFPMGHLIACTEDALGADFRLMGRKVQHVASAWM